MSEFTALNKKPSVMLTQSVQKGGCAAKVAAAELRKILEKVRFPPGDSSLLIDGGLFDDAAIYKISEELALVQTLDFFTPILDDPMNFGAVAAANALSDVYAMGGKPKTAMGILAFPVATMSSDIIVEVMQGASDKIAEAKAFFVGGHSIDDDTLKFGLSVTGFVHPDRIWSNAKALPGDHLILTKAVGTGALTAALKRQVVTEADIAEAISSMSQLNNCIDYLSREMIIAVHAATDITGFGLSGHLMQLAIASGVTVEIEFGAIPLLPQAKSFLEKGFLTKAHRSNHEYTKDQTDLSGLDSVSALVMHDPQTSGGLLLSVDATLSEQVVTLLRKHFKSATIIGKVAKFLNHRVKVEV